MAPSWLSRYLFRSIILVLWFAANFYVVGRFWSAAGLKGKRWIRISLVLVLAALFPVGHWVVGSGAGEWVETALSGMGMFWIGLVSISLSVFLLLDIGWRLTGVASRLLTRTPKWWRGVATGPGRRVWLGAIALVGVLVAWAVVGGHAAPRIRREVIPFAGAHCVGKSLTIAHLSDLHLGKEVGVEAFASMVDQVASLSPDVVVMTGDLLDDVGPHTDEALRELDRLHPPLGIYAVTGNHELYEGPDYFRASMERHGVQVLSQSHVVLPNGVVLAGIDDTHFFSRGKVHAATVAEALDAALAGVAQGGCVVLLSHRPEVALEAAERGVSLVLSGHTHAGQLPPFQIISPWFNGGFLGGLYKVQETVLNVSRGAGTWGPRMRLFAPSEIVFLQMTGVSP